MSKYPPPEVRREESRSYYLRHRAEILRKVAEYRRKNRERVLEGLRRYYHEHREEAAQKRVENRRNNREREREAARRFYQEHREGILEKQKKYYQDHHDERWGQQRQWRTTFSGRLMRQCGGANRRARKRGVSGTLTDVHILVLLDRQKKKCAVCREPFLPVGTYWRFDIDHIIPLGRGLNDFGNVQLLCRKCNQGKGNKG